MSADWKERDDGTVEVPQGYQCPLCPCKHAKGVFFSSQLVGAPICQGCTIDLSHYLEREERTEDPLLDALERVTGLGFRECRIRYYRESVELYRRKLLPERVEREIAFEMSHTRRSREDVITQWRRVMQEYKAELARLELHTG